MFSMRSFSNLRFIGRRFSTDVPKKKSFLPPPGERKRKPTATKAELLELWQEKNKKEMGLLHSAASWNRLFTSIFDVIHGELRAGKVVRISNFGTFRMKDQAERKVKTGLMETAKIVSARKRVTFSPTKTVKALTYDPNAKKKSTGSDEEE